MAETGAQTEEAAAITPWVEHAALHTKWRGMFEYGALATAQGRQFERKWLTRVGHIDASVLEASDFSATTDL